MTSKFIITIIAALLFFNANSQTISLKDVCTSQTKTYGIDEPENDVVYHWTVSGGVLDSETGSQITIKWQTSPGEGKITVYCENSETKCQSDKIVYTVKIQKAPSIEFDNSFVCFGQPLKITLSGSAPFEVFYTLNSKEKTLKILETEYVMENIPGKYLITKVKDNICEFLPTENNKSEILPELKKLKIIEE